MLRRTIRLCVVVFGISAPVCSAAAASDNLRRLSGAQVAKLLVGMELTDDVHWVDRYERDGTLVSHGMGKVIVGRWRVEKNELCLDRELEPGTGCYEVWIAGNTVELRQPALDLKIRAVLQKPQRRGGQNPSTREQGASR